MYRIQNGSTVSFNVTDPSIIFEELGKDQAENWIVTLAGCAEKQPQHCT